MTAAETGRDAVVVAPHRFPHLHAEEALAAGHGAPLIVTADQAALVAALPRARVVLMTPFARLGRPELELAEGCEGIVRYGVGYDNVDVDAARELGIAVANVPDASVEEVALHALAMALSLLRRLSAADAELRAGRWGPAVMDGVKRLSDLTVAVVGLGRIGARLAHHFDALGAHVIAADPHVRESPFELVDVDSAFERADVVSLHLPFTEASRDLVNGERLARMRRGCIVVNVSRGGLVDEPALAAALHSGQVAGAALDVFAEEPLPPDSPLRTAPNVLLSAHLAWRSDASLGELQVKAVEQAEHALSGQRMTSIVNQPA